MITWTIDSAKGARDVCDVLVSTESAAIGDIARDAGALVPWLRPPELATDTASAAHVALHALDRYESEKGRIDGLLLLQPTSPFRTRATIERGIALFQERNRRPVVAVAPAASHPMWCFTVEGIEMKPFLAGGGLHLRSQDLPAAFVVSGALYLIAPDDLRRNASFQSDADTALILDSAVEAIDIDTEWDWTIAEIMVRAGLA